MLMTAYTQPTAISDVLLIEVHSGWTKDTVTIAPTQTLAIGQVVGQVTATGQFVILAPAAADGSQIAAGVVLDQILPTAATQKAAVIARGAVVNAATLVWPGGITAPQKTLATTQLQTLGIVARTNIL